MPPLLAPRPIGPVRAPSPIRAPSPVSGPLRGPVLGHGPVLAPSPASPGPFPAPPSGLRGANAGRQSRFDQRSARRWGDWGILGVSAAFLWLENDCMLATGDPLMCSGAPADDLWP